MHQAAAITPPAADDVSVAITALFASHVDEFSAVNAKASAFHTEFVKMLSGGAGLHIEVANPQQRLVAIDGQARALLGNPLSGLGGVAPVAAMTEVSYLDTPFGRLEVVRKVTASADDGTGPVSVLISATTPFGDASWSITGFAPAGETEATIGVTGGSNQLSPRFRLLVAAGGSMFTGGFSLLDGVSEFSSALGSGDFLGNAADGTDTVERPIGSFADSDGPTVSMHPPFGGFAMPPAPVMLSMQGCPSTDDSGSLMTYPVATPPSRASGSAG
ncbi:hypothetical protein BHQ20_00605 [Mycobacterium intermedium]|nr:hypothetical protein BHQ20_00605 [Mycobacterium intermedium]